jgi:anti-sigma regulatory factor (Ser/Thr protein kinase)
MTARLPVGPRTVALATAFARRFAERAGLAEETAHRLTLVVEELVANVVEHGGAPAAGRLVMRLEPAGQGARLSLSDAGIAFDPRAVEDVGPNLDRGGGAGIALIRGWSEIESYSRRGGRNRLALRLRS